MNIPLWLLLKDKSRDLFSSSPHTSRFFERKTKKWRRKKKKMEGKKIIEMNLLRLHRLKLQKASFEWSNLSIIIHNHQCINFHFYLHSVIKTPEHISFMQKQKIPSRSRGARCIQRHFKSSSSRQIYKSYDSYRGWFLRLKSFFTLHDESTHEKNIIIKFYSWNGI